MKKIGLIFWSFFAIITCSIKASPVKVETAKSVAEVFCAKRGITGELSLSEVKREGCYIFNSSDNGFVIVAANDNITPILGYSKKGSINENSKKAVAFTSWLNSIDEGVDSLLSKIDEAKIDKSKWELLKSGNFPVTTRNSQSVGPLLSTKWAQYEPFNLLCPENSLAGCVAVAMAQVMKYYNHPQKGIGSSEEYVTKTNNYIIPSVSLDTEYDWDNMLDDYSGDFSQVQVDAVSKLLYHCGITTFMDYDSEGSGTVVRNAAKALYGHFDYDKSIRYCERKHFTDEQWHSLLKEQLNMGYPIIYSGRNESATDGHSFICDGYDEYGFYHFNFGWGGYCDGYYMPDYILPIEESVNEIVSDYSYAQNALINIFPNENGSYYYDFINVVPEDFSILRETITERKIVEISNKFFNTASESFEGELLMEIWDEDKNLLHEAVLTSVTIDAFAYLTFSNMKINFIQFPNGTYYLSFKLRDANGKDYAIRDAQGSVALRKVVVNLPQEESSVNFVYEWSDYFEVSPDTVFHGEYLDVEACVTNVSESIFKGTAFLIIYNSAGDTARVLEGATFEAGFLEGACLYWEIPIDESFVGDYYVEVLLQDESGKMYDVSDAENSDNKRNFFVNAPILPEVPQCDFICKNSSDLEVVVESSSGTITRIAVSYVFFNEGIFNFSGTVNLDIVNESGRVVATLPSDQLTIDVAQGYQGGLKIDLDCFPNGEYYMVIRLEDTDGNDYYVKDTYCETAKGTFTIDETIGHPLVFSPDNSLHISVCNQQLNLYSEKKQEVAIYDLYGRVVKEMTVDGIFCVELPSGMYLIKSKDSVFKVIL